MDGRHEAASLGACRSLGKGDMRGMMIERLAPLAEEPA